MRNILILLLLFLVAQLLGMFVGSVLIGDYNTNPYVQELYFTYEGESSSFFGVITLFVLILLGTAFLLFLIKYYKGDLLFLLMEFFLIAVPSSIVFYSFARFYFPYMESMVIGITLGLLLALFKLKFNSLKNVAAIFASSAVGALLGLSFSPVFAILFLVILAVYDYIAVFKTKHMVVLAKEVLGRKMPLTISSEVKVPKIGVRRIDLGTGDVLAPIMLEVSFFKVDPFASLLALVGASIAVFLIFYLSRDKKVILPALPPIVAGMLIALLIGFLVKLIFL